MAKTKKPAVKETKKPTKAKRKPAVKKAKKTDKQDSISLDELMSQMGIIPAHNDDQLNEGVHNDCCQCSGCADDGAYPAVIWDSVDQAFSGPFHSDKEVDEWLKDMDENGDYTIFTLVAPAKIAREWAFEDVDTSTIHGFRPEDIKASK